MRSETRKKEKEKKKKVVERKELARKGHRWQKE